MPEIEYCRIKIDMNSDYHKHVSKHFVRQGSRTFCIVAALMMVSAWAQSPKLRTPGVDCPVVRHTDGSTSHTPCNRPDFVEKAPPPVFPFSNVPSPKLPEAPPQTHGINLTINTDENAKAYHDWLCRHDAGEYIFHTAENVEGIYEMRSREQSYKIHFEKYGLYRPGDSRPSQTFVHDRYFLEDPLGMIWFGDFRPDYRARADYPKIPAGMIGHSLKGYVFVETAIWQADLPNYGGARFFRHEPVFPPEVQITESGTAIMPAHRQIVTKRTPVNELKSRYGYFWRGITRSPYDRALGIAGSEFIILDLSTNEIMAYTRSWGLSRRNRARADPVEREAQSNWHGYGCSTTPHQQGKWRLFERVLKPGGISVAYVKASAATLAGTDSTVRPEPISAENWLAMTRELVNSQNLGDADNVIRLLKERFPAAEVKLRSDRLSIVNLMAPQAGSEVLEGIVQINAADAIRRRPPSVEMSRMGRSFIDSCITELSVIQKFGPSKLAVGSMPTIYEAPRRPSPEALWNEKQKVRAGPGYLIYRDLGPHKRDVTFSYEVYPCAMRVEIVANPAQAANSGK